MMNQEITIKDCLPLVNGLWSHINYSFPDIFDIDASQLDILFLSSYSMRTPSPLLHVIHDSTVQLPLSSQELDTLAGIINGMYKHKWDKLMDVAVAEYDPIHNYYDSLSEIVQYSEDVDISKTGTGSHTDTRTDNLTETRNLQKGNTDTFNKTDTTTDTRTITETHNMNNSGSNSSEDNIYGFNSSTAVGDSNSSGSNSNLETGTITDVHSGTMSVAQTGTIQSAGSETGTVANTGTQQNVGNSSSSESGSNDTSGERSREYVKTGNIGNISTQKLLNEEIELWKYNFICEIMRDVAGTITLPIYSH